MISENKLHGRPYEQILGCLGMNRSRKNLSGNSEKKQNKTISQNSQVTDEGKPQGLCGGNQCPDNTAPAAHRRLPKKI